MAQARIAFVKDYAGIKSNASQLLNVKRMLDLVASGNDTFIDYETQYASNRILCDDTYASFATDVASYATKIPEIAVTGKNGNNRAETKRINSDTLYRAYEDLKNKQVITGINGANTGDLFTLPAGSVVAGTRVRFTAGPTSNFALNTDYFVINPSGANFQIAATRGGSAIVLNADCAGLTMELFQKSIIEVYPDMQQSLVRYSTDLNMVQIAAAFNA
jgi:hypothetical protein